MLHETVSGNPELIKNLLKDIESLSLIEIDLKNEINLTDFNKLKNLRITYCDCKEINIIYPKSLEDLTFERHVAFIKNSEPSYLYNPHIPENLKELVLMDEFIDTEKLQRCLPVNLEKLELYGKCKKNEGNY